MKTSTPKPPAPRWLLVDAEGQVLGRLAARVAMILRGKHRPEFSPHQICGDHVVEINAAKLNVVASKFRRKTYFTHTGYVGHTRVTPLKRMMEERPDAVIEKAVEGMLPHNRLRPLALKRLHVSVGPEHAYAAQKPTLTKLS